MNPIANPALLSLQVSERQAPAQVFYSTSLQLRSAILTILSLHYRSRRAAYKNKGIFGQEGTSPPPDGYAPTLPPCPSPLFANLRHSSLAELRRRREEAQVEIRKQKREESVAKRRNFVSATSGGESDDDGGVDTAVRFLLCRPGGRTRWRREGS